MADRQDLNFYHLMLDLPEEITCPDHYELLGLDRFEHREKTIRDAAVGRNGELLKWQNSEFHRDADRLMDEVVAARDVLLSPEQKGKYDRKLQWELGLVDEDVPAPPEGKKQEPDSGGADPVGHSDRRERLAGGRNRAVAIGAACATVLILFVAAFVAFTAFRAGRNHVAEKSEDSRNHVPSVPPKDESPQNEADPAEESEPAKIVSDPDEMSVEPDADQLSDEARYEKETREQIKNLDETGRYEEAYNRLESEMAVKLLSAFARKGYSNEVKEAWYAHRIDEDKMKLKSLYEDEDFQTARGLEKASLPEALKNYEKERQQALSEIRDQAFADYLKKVDKRTIEPLVDADVRVIDEVGLLRAYEKVKSVEDDFPQEEYKSRIEGLKVRVLYQAIHILCEDEAIDGLPKRFFPEQARKTLLDLIKKSPDNGVQTLLRRNKDRLVFYSVTVELLDPVPGKAKAQLNKNLQKYFKRIRDSIQKKVAGVEKGFFVVKLTRVPRRNAIRKIKAKMESIEIYNGIDCATLRVVHWMFFRPKTEEGKDYTKYTWQCETVYKTLSEALAKTPGAKFVWDPTKPETWNPIGKGGAGESLNRSGNDDKIKALKALLQGGRRRR